MKTIMARNKWVQIIILGVVLIIGTVTVIASTEGGDIPVQGDAAPNFTLYSLDGHEVQLADYRGKYVVLNFWGSFCPPCVQEMPLLQSKYEEYKDQDVVVLAVNLDESTVAIRDFIRNMGLSFPILLDKNIIRKQYGVYNYPTTFFLDQQGVIRDIYVGEMTQGSLNNIDLAIRRLLYS